MLSVSDLEFNGKRQLDSGRDLYAEWVRLSSDPSRYGAWDTINTDTPRTPLADHPAVLAYRKGVTTEDLTSFIESFASLRAGRVRGVGAKQYAHSTGQKFEKFSFNETVKELIEELADASNYIDFLAIKLLSLIPESQDTGIDCD